MASANERGLTPNELAKLLRVSRDPDATATTTAGCGDRTDAWLQPDLAAAILAELRLIHAALQVQDRPATRVHGASNSAGRHRSRPAT